MSGNQSHSVLEILQQLKTAGRKGLALLADPDKADEKQIEAIAEMATRQNIDLLLTGGSLLSNGHMQGLVRGLRRHSNIPVVIFPGNVLQITPEADAILLLSLISGRNPELLIGQHVLAAPLLRQSGLEVIPTGYMLIESGRMTTANYMSNTLPIPRDKSDIAVCTAMAGELLGLKLIYMDAGSGAEHAVSPQMVEAVSKAVSLPVIVGGGIRSQAQAGELLAAGADMIVVGNALEQKGGASLLKEISSVVSSF